MNQDLEIPRLLALWVTFALVAVTGIIAVLVWAVRTRQFSDQDRARYLPLQSGIPEEHDEHARTREQQTPAEEGRAT